MFAKLGEFVVRAWPAVLIAWVIAVVCASIAAPGLDRVAETEEFAFLPTQSPSHLAESLFRKAFPDGYCPSRIVIIATRDTGITPEDENFLDDGDDEDEKFPFNDPERKFELRERLLKIMYEEANDEKVGSPVISGIRSFRDPNAGALLKSKRGDTSNARLMLVELTDHRTGLTKLGIFRRDC